MLKVFGIKFSRAGRTLWMCRELGLPIEHVQVNFADDTTKTPEFLHASPGGKVPAISDDGFELTESMAINIYLAKKHGALIPKDLQGESQVLRWSFWVVTEIEKHLLNLLLQRMPTPADAQAAKYFRDRNPLNPELEKASAEALEKPFAVLNEHLQSRDYLVGSTFTVADLNVASIMLWAPRSRVDLSPWPHLQKWFERCAARPAAKG